MTASPPLLDCAVVGGGPAGLTAAMYLRRFHRAVVLLDAGHSRARWIPESNNCPGFPSGVAGVELLATLRAQAGRFGIAPTPGLVTRLERDPEGFVLGTEDGDGWRARRVILATGILDVLPEVPWVDLAIDATAMRLCAICDGFEASDGALAVYGPLATALPHARFLRTYSRDVTVLPSEPAPPTAADRTAAAEAGVQLLAPPDALEFDGGHCVAVVAGERRAFDALYPALGSRPQSGLATGLGARVDDEGALLIDGDKMTSVDGLYAIGDVACTINQISVATGHAAIAATAVHNALPPNPRAAPG
jgi:thioredoxin reductase (NADPH)